MSADRRQLVAFALLGFVMILWSGNTIVGRAVRFDVPPLTLAFVRWAGATLILLPFAWRPLRADWPALRKGWKETLLLGLLGVGLFNSLIYTGLRYTTATNGLLLQAGIPAAVVLFERMAFGVRSPLVQIAGVLCAIIGVAVVVFEGDPTHALSLRFGFGDLLILLAVLVWALYTVFLRLRPAVRPVTFVFATFLIGAIVLAPFAASEWLAGERIRPTKLAFGAFAYVCVFPSIISYFIFNSAAGIVGPARAGVSITLMPVIGAFLSAALLDEPLHAYHFAGMATIMLGIVLSIVAMRRQARAAANAGLGAGTPLEDGT
ncbi:DMT family transporter [Tsuneonella sp. HG222]